jgi:hypothetical protein
MMLVRSRVIFFVVCSAPQMGAGFFPMGSPSAGVGGTTPSMAALKAAKAAREAGSSSGAAAGGHDDGMMAVDIDTPAASPLSSPLSARPKPASARRARTLPQFSPK